MIRVLLAALTLVLFSSTIAEARRLPWCGIYMNQYFGKNDRSLWVARNWAREGAPATGPAVGVVVVWRHHVGVIQGSPDASGRWLVHSGNDGNAVRTRYRSLRGAIAFRYIGGGRSAYAHLEGQEQAQRGGFKHLVSLTVERRSRTTSLRQPRAHTPATVKPFAVFGNAQPFAHATDFTAKSRTKKSKPVMESQSVFFPLFAPVAETVHPKLRKVRSHHRHHLPPNRRWTSL